MLDLLLLFATFFGIIVFLCLSVLAICGTVIISVTLYRAWLYNKLEIQQLGEEISPKEIE